MNILLLKHLLIIIHKYLAVRYFKSKKKNLKQLVYQCGIFFLNILTSTIDETLPVLDIYMDKSKAFDYVDDKILRWKLNINGITGNIYNFLESYLQNRLKYMVCNKNQIDLNTNLTSEIKQIEYLKEVSLDLYYLY